MYLFISFFYSFICWCCLWVQMSWNMHKNGMLWYTEKLFKKFGFRATKNESEEPLHSIIEPWHSYPSNIMINIVFFSMPWNIWKQLICYKTNDRNLKKNRLQRVSNSDRQVSRSHCWQFSQFRHWNDWWQSL